MTKKGVAAVLAVAAAVTAVAVLQYYNTQGLKQANSCLEIYQEQLPESTHIKHFTIGNRKIRVEYMSTRGRGEVTCEATEDGLLDDVATLNQKIDALWSR